MDPLTRNNGVQRPKTTAGVRGQTYRSAQARAAYASRAQSYNSAAQSAQTQAQTQPQTARPVNPAYATAPAREITPTVEPAENFEAVSYADATNKTAKGGNKLIAVIITLVVAIVAFVGGLFLGQNWDNFFAAKTEEKPAVEKPEVSFRDLTAAEQQDLSDKVAYLMLADKGSDFIKMGYYRLLPSVVSNVLTDADKLQIAIYSLRDEYTDTGAAKTISSARVSARYQEVFGTDLVYVESAYCPGYTLSTDGTLYTITDGCGGFSDDSDLLYKEAFYFKDDYAYADIAVGSVYLDASGEDLGVDTIYTDFFKSTSKSVYKTGTDFASLEDFSAFTINADNSANFALYTLRFKADDSGNFYFVDAAAATRADKPAEIPLSMPGDAQTEPTDSTITPSDLPAEPTEPTDSSTPAEAGAAATEDDFISYKTDPDAPACPRYNPYARCVD